MTVYRALSELAVTLRGLADDVRRGDQITASELYEAADTADQIRDNEEDA